MNVPKGLFPPAGWNNEIEKIAGTHPAPPSIPQGERFRGSAPVEVSKHEWNYGVGGSCGLGSLANPSWI